MIQKNRYNQPFYSLVDYKIRQFIVKNNKLKLVTTTPSKDIILDNIENIKSWGFSIDIEQDIVYNSNGVLMFTVKNKYTNLEDVIKNNPFLKLYLDKGYKLKLASCFKESILPNNNESRLIEKKEIIDNNLLSAYEGILDNEDIIKRHYKLVAERDNLIKNIKIKNNPDRLGIYCTNYEDFKIPKKEFKYTSNALFLLKKEEIKKENIIKRILKR